MELPVRWGSKLEVRAVVRFFAVWWEKPVEIYRLICETYGDECPVITIRVIDRRRRHKAQPLAIFLSSHTCLFLTCSTVSAYDYLLSWCLVRICCPIISLPLNTQLTSLRHSTRSSVPEFGHFALCTAFQIVSTAF